MFSRYFLQPQGIFTAIIFEGEGYREEDFRRAQKTHRPVRARC